MNRRNESQVYGRLGVLLKNDNRNIIVVSHTCIPRSLWVFQRVGHGDFRFCLASGFKAESGIQTENVRNTDALDLDLLPYLESGGAALKFYRVEAHCRQTLDCRVSTCGAYRKLSEEA